MSFVLFVIAVCGVLAVEVSGGKGSSRFLKSIRF